LEQKPRFWHLFTYFNPTSPITYGSFLLTLYPMVGVIYAYFPFKGITGGAQISRTTGRMRQAHVMRCRLSDCTTL
jgi:tetrathionate reductase subunit C